MTANSSAVSIPAVPPREFDDRLLGAPAVYLTPAERPSLEEARRWCKTLATTHYENFHVAAFVLPSVLRPNFHSVYAFCRTSDDLGDEVGDTETATRLLSIWRAMLQQCFLQPERSRHPVYVALQPTIAQCHLPMEPFDDLISAFEQDQVYTHHESLETLERYSRYSANPVGRLVLMLCGYHSEDRLRLSDEICTGLQLANFYQDIVEDRARGRRYIPADAMRRFHVSDEQLVARQFDANVRAMMEFLVADARARLNRGARLVDLVAADLAWSLRLFVKGGNAILDAIAAQGYDTLRSRPVVTKAAKLKLLAGAVTGKLLAAFGGSAAAGAESGKDRIP
ncbi:MAG: squalene synthase HpnC [Acidobacteriaceae bacterium]